MRESGDAVDESLNPPCELPHARPDMNVRIASIFVSGVALGVILASLALWAILSL